MRHFGAVFLCFYPLLLSCVLFRKTAKRVPDIVGNWYPTLTFWLRYDVGLVWLLLSSKLEEKSDFIILFFGPELGFNLYSFINFRMYNAIGNYVFFNRFWYMILKYSFLPRQTLFNVFIWTIKKYFILILSHQLIV